MWKPVFSSHHTKRNDGYFDKDIISQLARQTNAHNDSDEDDIGFRYSIFGLDLKF